jgi:hypothetical protein
MASWHAIFSGGHAAIRHVADGTNAKASANAHPSQRDARGCDTISSIMACSMGLSTAWLVKPGCANSTVIEGPPKADAEVVDEQVERRQRK